MSLCASLLYPSIVRIVVVFYTIKSHSNLLKLLQSQKQMHNCSYLSYFCSMAFVFARTHLVFAPRPSCLLELTYFLLQDLCVCSNSSSFWSTAFVLARTTR